MLFYTVTKEPDSNQHPCFSSVTKALSAIPRDTEEEVTIFVQPGEYYEKITITRPDITIIGTNASECILTYDDYAYDEMPEGGKRGTFRSYSMFVDADRITLKNLTIRNTSSPRSRVGQALALYADGDRLSVLSCRLESYQDTLFTGPLPPAPMQPGGFTGPKEFAERRMTRQYYKDCCICGDIDFIFGSGTAFFESCEIRSVASEILPEKDGRTPVYGYVTAASTPEGEPFGYVFSHCRFTSDCPRHSVYLGRPWRDYAKTVLLYCELQDHIRPEGFHDWGKPHARENCYYAEYKCFGPGADTSLRDDFVKSLTDTESLLYTRENVLGF